MWKVEKVSGLDLTRKVKNNKKCLEILKSILTLKERNDKDLELVEKYISNMLDVPGISKIFFVCFEWGNMF